MNSVDFFSKYLLEKLGDKFWVVTLIPSTALVFAIVIVFDPLLNFSSSIAIQGTLTERLSIVLGFIIAPSIILAFILYAVQTYILQLYEGYIFFRHLPFLVKRQSHKANKLLLTIAILKEHISELESKEFTTAGSLQKLRTLKNQYYQLAAEYDQSFPYSTDLILPTRLGNILRASETYPTVRYGMDAVSWWPRLYNFIPKETKQGIEGALNELYILLNLSVLSAIFFVLCLVAFFYFSIIPVTIIPEVILRYVYAGLVALSGAWFFYRISLQKAGAFGNQIRSAYDLYRLQLLEQMKMKRPENSIDEFHIWKNLGEFIVMRDFSLEFTHFDYVWTSQDKKQSDSTTQLESKTAAQQSVHWTLGILWLFQAFFWIQRNQNVKSRLKSK